MTVILALGQVKAFCKEAIAAELCIVEIGGKNEALEWLYFDSMDDLERVFSGKFVYVWQAPMKETTLSCAYAIRCWFDGIADKEYDKFKPHEKYFCQ